MPNFVGFENLIKKFQSITRQVSGTAKRVMNFPPHEAV